MKKNSLILFVSTLLVFAGCQKDPLPVNEEEVITTLLLSILKNGDPRPELYIFNDPDGDGGLAPTIDSLILDKDADYTAQLTLINKLKTPADTISNEVAEESEEHQFFYESAEADLISSLTYLDTDGDGKPLGLQFSFSTKNEAESGSLTITLRHLPNKSASDVASGDVTNAGGETDIEVTFPVRLK